MQIKVLRLGHRPFRDKRVTTHLMLAARAFGSSESFYTGTKDISVEDTVRKVVRDWGGDFEIVFCKSWRSAVGDWKNRGKIVHLTMYGLPIQDVISTIRENPADKLVIVGGAKVPGEIFSIADWNVAVTSQPHSEVSALAVFLHMLLEGKEMELSFEGARLRIVPQKMGKKVDHYPSNV